MLLPCPWLQAEQSPDDMSPSEKVPRLCERTGAKREGGASDPTEKAEASSRKGASATQTALADIRHHHGNHADCHHEVHPV